MRRPSEELLPDHDIIEFKTIFEWNQCYVCRYEVRREKMWNIVARGGISHVTDYDICKTCLPTIEDAMKWRDNKNNIATFSLPPVPPRGKSGESK